MDSGGGEATLTRSAVPIATLSFLGAELHGRRSPVSQRTSRANFTETGQ
jgi:hypothetical protein